MEQTIDISQCTIKYYKHMIVHGNVANQFIPIIVIEAPVNFNNENINIVGSRALSNFFGNSFLFPVWGYKASKDSVPRMFLEIYQDEKIRISTNVRSWNDGTYQTDYTYAILSESGDSIFSRRSYGNSNSATCECFLFMFLKTTDNKYIINNYSMYQFNGDIDTVPTPDKSKGTITASQLSIDNIFYGTDNTEIANRLLKGLKPQRIPDENDPNDGGGDSAGGGGGGAGDIGGDTNPDDGLPTISALDSGLLTAYNPTVGELQSLGKFLWSDSFNVDTFKKLFNDPFDTLLGLSITPIQPNTSGRKNIMFGNLDSGVSAPVVANQWATKDMGSVTLKEVWKGALDYAPSTSASIYLPFIGMRQLNINDVMGSTLHLIYKFDVLTGGCVAQIYINHNAIGNKDSGFSWTPNQGLVYEFMGQCAVNIPLASQDFTNTIRSAVSAVGMVAGASASIATGNPVLGIATATVASANLGMQANTPTVERSGHLSGSCAILGYSQPFLVVTRPHQCKPSRYYALRGVPSQVYTSKLSNCTGFTQITANNNIHCSGAQDTELQEIQNLLVSGVYFPDSKR